MNTMTVASTGTTHNTDAEVPTYTSGQTRERVTCTGRMVYGYVNASGESPVDCPKCLAKAAKTA